MAIVFRPKMAGKHRDTRELNLWRVWGIPEPEREYVFSDTRKFRLDLAWPVFRLGVEVEGQIYSGKKKCPMCGRPMVGGHSSVSGLLRDFEKGNLLALLGWHLLRFTWQDFDRGDAYRQIKAFLDRKGSTL